MKKQNKVKELWHIFQQCSIDLRDDHVSAYAARSAFFFLLALIPCMILLLQLLQLTPVSEAEFIEAVRAIFPDTISPLLIRIIREVFASSIAVVPLNIVVAIWSAGVGIMALSDGLNCIHDVIETRNYFYLRLRAGIYTIFFLGGIVFLLAMQVFGRTWTTYVGDQLPFLRSTMRKLLEIRDWIVIPVILLLSLGIYRLLPNRKVRLVAEIPGAVFNLVGWMFCSYLFSVYLDWFQNFANIYGSLTTIILVMLWLYFCMYVLLLGAEVNVWFRTYGLIERLPLIGKIYRRGQEAYVEKIRIQDMEAMRIREEKDNRLKKQENYLHKEDS